MSDYLPEAFPGDLFTFDAGEAITGGRLVQVGAADMAVVGATAASLTVVGVAGRDAASGAKVPVYLRGTIHRLKAKGAVTRGDLVTVNSTDADGEVSTIDTTPAAFTIADVDIDGTPDHANVEAAIKAGVDAGLAVFAGVVGLALESIADDASGRVMFI